MFYESGGQFLPRVPGETNVFGGSVGWKKDTGLGINQGHSPRFATCLLYTAEQNTLPLFLSYRVDVIPISQECYKTGKVSPSNRSAVKINICFYCSFLFLNASFSLNNALGTCT